MLTLVAWFCHPILGSNGPHCIKLLSQMGKLPLDQVPNEPLAMVKKSLCFENPIELYILLVGAYHFGVHDLSSYSIFYVIRFISIMVNCSTTYGVSNKGGTVIKATP
jgi:hypothetical protein